MFHARYAAIDEHGAGTRRPHDTVLGMRALEVFQVLTC